MNLWNLNWNQTPSNSLTIIITCWFAGSFRFQAPFNIRWDYYTKILFMFTLVVFFLSFSLFLFDFGSLTFIQFFIIFQFFVSNFAHNSNAGLKKKVFVFVVGFFSLLQFVLFLISLHALHSRLVCVCVCVFGARLRFLMNTYSSKLDDKLKPHGNTQHTIKIYRQLIDWSSYCQNENKRSNEDDIQTM